MAFRVANPDATSDEAAENVGHTTTPTNGEATEDHSIGHTVSDSEADSTEVLWDQALSGSSQVEASWPPRMVAGGTTNNKHMIQTQSKTRFDEAIDNLESQLSNQLQQIVEDGYDTLVYLGEPPQATDQDSFEYEYIKEQFKRPYFMKSTTLRALGSSKFDKFLGPMSARTERRLKKKELHKMAPNPAAIKYYVDLSPAINDEEAMLQLTELTVPAGALAWHQYAGQFGVPTNHVCGRDKIDVPRKLMYKQSSTSDSIEKVEETDSTMVDESTQMSKKERNAAKKKEAAMHADYRLSIEEEYSSLRHHSTLARLLHAVVGNDPKLNSAPKAWTYCMLANYYDCAHYSRISYHIIDWLMQRNNLNFIQTNPDIAYRIGIATQSTWLVRSSFAILAGQQALLAADNDARTSAQPNGVKNPYVTSCLDDDDINRVDHAATMLTRRAKTLIEELVVHPGIWNDAELGCETERLFNVEHENIQITKAVDKVKTYLKHYIQRIVFMTLSDAYDVPEKDLFKPFKRFNQYSEVPCFLKPLTQCFWTNLRAEKMSRDYIDSTKNHQIWARTLEVLQGNALVPVQEDIPYVSKHLLYNAVEELNDLTAPHRTYSWEHDDDAGVRSQHLDTHELPTSPTKKLKSAADNRRAYQGYTYQEPKYEGRTQSSNDEPEIDAYTGEHFKEHAASDPISASLDPLSGSSDGFSPTAHPAQTANEIDEDDIVDLEAGLDRMASSFHEESPSHALPFRQRNKENKTAMPLLHSTPTPFSPEPLISIDPNLPSAPPSSPKRTRDDYLRNPLTSDSWETPAKDQGQAELNTSPTRETNSAALFGGSFRGRIDGVALLNDIAMGLHRKVGSMLRPGYIVDGTCDLDIPVNDITTLLCLGEEEYKYLPLWAGGFDDGSGGVFSDGMEVPDAADVVEWRGGAMGLGFGIGSSAGGSVIDSEFEDIRTESGMSTVQMASKYATDGTATETVISLDE